MMPNPIPPFTLSPGDDVIDLFFNKGSCSFAEQSASADCIEIHYIMEGSGYHLAGDQRTPVRSGQLLLAAQGTTHGFCSISSSDKESELLIGTCVFESSLLRQWETLLTNHAAFQALLNPEPSASAMLTFEDTHKQLRPIFTGMHHEHQQKIDGYPLMLAAMLMQLFVCLQRMSAIHTPSAYCADPLVDSMIDYIHEHYRDTLTVQQVADHFFISASHFQRLFKRARGVTFKQYLQALRIRKCCELLRASQHSIQRIANDIGYQDMKFFHSLFRKKIGVTPQQYRNHFRPGPSAHARYTKSILFLKNAH